MPLASKSVRSQPRPSSARAHHERRAPSRLASGLGLASILAMTMALGACKNKDKDTCTPDDYVYEEIALHIQAAADLNVNDEGEALPTVVRIYQLNGDLATRSLDFTELWEDHETALGDEYISDKEIQIFPDSTELIKITPESGVKYILAFGVFNQPVGNTWFRIYEVPKSYGQQACELKKEEKDPATLGEPCMYLYMERNQIDGGKNVPPGFDEDTVEATCTPLYTPKTKTVEEDEDDKDKDK